ncbi:peptidase M13 [Steroidobacter sp. S1-65]|uniref:Peptidase M13 n=1 Tax=Steroidobacter gossypii TaxID=2805490 RepID=A0ABS1X2V1_9GAMM|nr:M13-type metalloendopeptidase [Steroidobacter gossypii]MBM0107552.1 peptidase M13 [Steroidobacter gossypii]
MNTKPLLAAFSCALLLSACSTSPQDASQAAAPAAATMRSGVYLSNLDRAVRPQDDFYRFVNGQWLASTTIPADRSNYGAFSLLEDGAEQDLKAILEEAAAADAPAGSDTQKVGDLYASFLDEATVEARGLTPLAGELKRIDELNSKQDVARYIGYIQRISVRHPFAYYVSIDRKNSSQYTGVIAQSGLGMPDRDYYLSEDARLKGIREKYQVYVKDLLAAADTPKAEQVAAKIFAIETQLAKSHWTRVQNRDAQKTYNRYQLAELPKLMPGFDWNAFFAGAQIPVDKTQALVVVQPSYFETLGKVIATTKVEDWRGYFRYKLLSAYAPDLPEKFAQLHFDFTQRTVSGIEEQKPRWKRAVDTVDGAVGDLVGKIYVERHFSPDAKRRMDEMVGNLLDAYRRGIDQLEWMTPATKQKAHAKLERFTTKIGYPSQWRDWSRLEIRRDDLVGNEMRAATVVFERNLAKLGGPIDRTEWFMTPQTVNAYYNPPSNEIVFPAAILQPPFFNVAADDAINYGAIGAVIGHEISHGFDDQGRRYDGAGNLNDWWAPEDNAEFTRRAKQLGEQYSALSPIPGLFVNGDLTMGENIADVAGLAMAYRAWQLSLNGKPAPVIDGFTGEQRFFIGWAQGWARKYREDELRRRLLTDPHSPSEYRTNAVVSNLPEFHAAFDVKPGDKMYKAPEDRVRIW